ncbi:hypothetical protein N7457_002886 [Penicillium paradoxum]|uniref:uncharacterized protein n=1 Tax=Penicillium paradoxum TaxID=176176 RepID=UPI002547DC63|nr:uncharacterized protein N7457_002886 [Penicillium paradoxum]KAJ5787896.1 hypothetical protein N7457_002886 [Penicillium paradoxum]
MCRDYLCLTSRSPRSFLFCIVANVGPGSASRSLAVAYRQGNDNDISVSPLARERQVVAETLALIEVLSDPANRAPLEAERTLANSCYRRSPWGNEDEFSGRPSIPDKAQPPFSAPDGWHRWDAQLQPELWPELPWNDDGLNEFPFTTTCLLLGLLRDNGDGDANATTRDSARPGDVQLQPLSTVFRGDCTEYGLVVIDISDFDSGVKYGIVGFPVRYMAEVWHHDPDDWDYVEDDPPVEEPDIVPITPRPRVPLSVLQWLRKYDCYGVVEEDSRVLRLEDMPLVDAAALDYIWPPELENRAEVESQDRTSSQGVISSISDYFWSSNATTGAEDESTTTASCLTTSHELPRSAHVDGAIDDLLILTQDPELHLDERTIDKFQQLTEFRDQLRRRLEEVPDSLGPSSEASGHILRIAYAGCMHLNWVAFRYLAPGLIAAAVASDELRGASALSLCVDNFDLEGCEGELGDLAAALANSTTLKQLCLLQRPDGDSDDASARFCTQLLLRGSASGDLGWLRDIIIYPTYAFSTSLRNRKLLSPSTNSVDLTVPVVQEFPMIHMFTFLGDQREDGADADHHHRQYQNSYGHYYDMSNTLLDAESFAVRFLSYLRSVGSGSDKAILRFAYGRASSSLTTTDNDNEKSPPSLSSGEFGVSPIPAGFFGNHGAANDQSRIRVRDLHPGSWVLLLAQRGRSSCDDDDVLLRYSFVRIGRNSAEIAPEQQQESPASVPNVVEVIGGLAEFLRETVRGIDISAYEKRIEEIEKDLRAQQGSIKTGKRYIGIGVMAETSAQAILSSYCDIPVLPG